MRTFKDICVGTKWYPFGGDDWRKHSRSERRIGKLFKFDTGRNLTVPGIYIGVHLNSIRDTLDGMSDKKYGFAYGWTDNIMSKYQVSQIMIEGEDSRVRNFIKYTYYCLDLLYMTDAGKKIIDNILQQCKYKQKKIYIGPSYMGGNQYLCKNKNASQCIVAQCLRTNSSHGGVINKWLEKLYPEERKGKVRRILLYQNICSGYIYTNGGCAKIKKRGGVPRFIRKEDILELNAARASLENAYRKFDYALLCTWVKNKKKDVFSETGWVAAQKRLMNEYLRNNIVVSLYGVSEAGDGSDVIINFMPGSYKGETRPPAIGLAHELIHAYYTVAGMQPDIPDTDIVLTEIICIGAGPEELLNVQKVPNENCLRKEWYNRKMQDKIKKYWKSDTIKDTLNLKKCTFIRPYYAHPEEKCGGMTYTHTCPDCVAYEE